jgi:hypothetical protein
MNFQLLECCPLTFEGFVPSIFVSVTALWLFEAFISLFRTHVLMLTQMLMLTRVDVDTGVDIDIGVDVDTDVGVDMC